MWPKGPDIRFGIPLGLGYLKSNTKDPRFQLKIFDCALENVDAWHPRVAEFLNQYRPHVVGASAWSNFFPQALELFRHAARLDPNVVTVMGGVHPSAYPSETIRNDEIDFVISGEGEFSFSAFLSELCSSNPDWTRVPGLHWLGDDGAACRNPMRPIENLDRISIPDYDFIDLDRYIELGYRMQAPHPRNAPIRATRGCPYRCEFCSSYVIDGKRIRRHSIDYMARWVRHLYDSKGIRWFNIIDDNFTFNVDYAKSFCQAVIDMKLGDVGFATSNGIRMQRGDPDLWHLMKKAGWRKVIVAPESGSPRTLELMKKDIKLETVPGIVEDISAAGLPVHGFFMVGYPGETREDMKKTYELIKKCRFSSVNIQRFLPLPGTPVYARLVEEGRIEPDFLPDAMLYGSVEFVDEAMQDFDYGLFILKTQLLMAFRNPSTYLAFAMSTGLSYIAGSLWDLSKSSIGGNKPVPRRKPVM